MIENDSKAHDVIQITTVRTMKPGSMSYEEYQRISKLSTEEQEAALNAATEEIVPVDVLTGRALGPASAEMRQKINRCKRSYFINKDLVGNNKGRVKTARLERVATELDNYRDDLLTDSEVDDLFQYLIDHDLLSHVQGSGYRAKAAELIAAGRCVPRKEEEPYAD